MKTMILLALLSASVQSAVVCKKVGRWYYPSNDTAKTIAASLGVKTCNGKRFKAVVAGLNESSNVAITKKKLSVEETIEAMKK